MTAIKVISYFVEFYSYIKCDGENVIFSIIIPVYDVEDYLDRCVQSVINQTYFDIEIILVDDGSPDLCPAKCDDYASKDKRIKVIHQKNKGLSDARNVGIEAATGDYILFLDSDDYIDLNAIERFLPFARRGFEIMVGDGVTEGGYYKLKHSFDCPVCNGSEFLKKALSKKAMPMAAWLNVYKRTFLLEKQLKFKPGILHEDEEFTPRAFLLASEVINTQICFYHYMVRSKSITNNKDLRKNATDLYNICLEQYEIFQTIKDKKLKKLLLDSLAVKYLHIFQMGKLQQYGNIYFHKKLIWRCSKCLKTRLKAWIYCMNPNLYWHINNCMKIMRIKKGGK